MKATKGRRRFIDYPRQGREGPRRWLPSWRQWLGTFSLGIICLAGLFALVYANVDIPNENELAGREATVYYWADGSQMVSVGAVNRQNITLDKVPDSVENSVIAAENATFYSDAGVSIQGIGRAVVNMISGEDTQGGSTITQQYVKNTYLSQDQTVTRKLKEFIISLKVSNQKSKREILRGYLNTSWFGRGSYGIQAAAHAYYGIDADKLNPSQGAMLAAVLKGSEQYDPGLSKANHERAVERWSWILDRQVTTGKMTEQERAKYREFPEPRALSKPTSQAGQIGYLIDIANKFIKAGTGLTDKDLARGGYRIHTTFDKQRTRRLEKAVNDVRRQNLDPKKRAADTFVEVGAASVRPKDGAIVALYGGTDATRHFSNNADTTAVPAGSAFKPFVLAAALQQQVDRPEVDDEARPVDRQKWFGDLTGALMNAENPPFVQAGQRIGLERIRDVAVAAGLREESMARLEQTFPLGTSAPSAIRMASAYTTFTNGGLHADPYAVTKMTYGGKKLPGFNRTGPEQVLDAGVAQQVSGALEGLGWRTLGIPGGKPVQQPVAAGLTEPGDRMKSAWFIGSAPAAGLLPGSGPGTGSGSWDGIRPDQAPGAGDGSEPTTAVTMFRNKPGAPELLPMNGVGGPKTGLGTTLPPKIWSAYQEAS
ncbi:penicillin-binding protein [Streptomyces inhibens]|uniref:Penicillin-binding protein n=1 Tax=Streptomyces inhibens TaxID=2293571 RepID=A0A371Q417_STRIH|nr:transglycosylase domain-containing protein [Streptomyces inhibens]REK89454.1 penicillin-binding protein [Streptomyces inhibens]